MAWYHQTAAETGVSSNKGCHAGQCIAACASVYLFPDTAVSTPESPIHKNIQFLSFINYFLCVEETFLLQFIRLLSPLINQPLLHFMLLRNSVRERTITTERPLLVGEVSANS
jgi:hypothetical protein